LKFLPPNIYNANQTCKDFIQASKIHIGLLFEHCSCYSDTRGVTVLLPEFLPFVFVVLEVVDSPAESPKCIRTQNKQEPEAPTQNRANQTV
jgi:hypothetical protein